MKQFLSSKRIAYGVSAFIHAALILVCFMLRFDAPRHIEEEPLVFYSIDDFIALTAPETPGPVENSLPEERRFEKAEDALPIPSVAESVPAVADRDVPALMLPEQVQALQESAEPDDDSIPLTPQQFTPFAHGDFTVPYADSSYLTPFQKGEVLFEGTPYALHPSWIPREDEKKVAPEDAQDERREFKGDMFGVRMDGPLALIPAMKHIGKSVVWDIHDGNHQDRIDDMRRTMFAGVTERDVRFLILMWRDGLLDILRLSGRDRNFIAQIPSDKPLTNTSYLKNMYSRGLADELQVEGRLVFRATFPRTEVLSVMCVSAYDSLATPDKESRLKLVNLITSCYDPSTLRIVIPDSLVLPGMSR